MKGSVRPNLVYSPARSRTFSLELDLSWTWDGPWPWPGSGPELDNNDQFSELTYLPVISETNIASHTSRDMGLNIVKREESWNVGFLVTILYLSCWNETVKSMIFSLSGVIVKSPITMSILLVARPWTIFKFAFLGKFLAYDRIVREILLLWWWWWPFDRPWWRKTRRSFREAYWPLLLLNILEHSRTF